MNNIKTITRLSLVAAIYAVFTIINPFSFGFIQFRISEILVLLCFYRKDYSYALIIGCLIANFFSPLSVYDIVFGTLATAISVLLISYSKRMWLASLYPVIFNGIIIGLLWYLLGDDEITLYAAMIYVAIGEFVVVSIFGVAVFSVLKKKETFLEFIEANQNVKTNS